MKTKSNKAGKKITLLICGSQNFEDRAFVYGILDKLYEGTNHGISHLLTSKFSGACSYAREWVELTNSESPQDQQITHSDCTFDMHAAKKNLSFYEEAELPRIIIQNDPFFQKGRELIISSSVNMVCAFPNKDGIMGAATRNIQRFCDIGEKPIPFLNAVEAYHLLKEQTYKQEQAAIRTDNLHNHHGMKR